MHQFVNINQLSPLQQEQNKKAVHDAFPEIIHASPTIEKYWDRLEKYFPEYQQYLISKKGDLIGFMNSVPFYIDTTLVDLSEEGWDWMLAEGVEGYERGQPANYLGGLQVIVRKEYQNRGFSKVILSQIKSVVRYSALSKLVIPIRPTKKYLFPNMSMSDYMKLKDGNRIYDPWIRTHVKNGAQIIKPCEVSMKVEGDLNFWEKILKMSIETSGCYTCHEALNIINIDYENNYGVYLEPNIWIYYD